MEPIPRKRTVFGRDDHLLTVSTCFHPFADPGFRVFALVIVGCIDEIAELTVNTDSHEQER